MINYVVRCTNHLTFPERSTVKFIFQLIKDQQFNRKKIVPLAELQGFESSFSWSKVELVLFRTGAVSEQTKFIQIYYSKNSNKSSTVCRFFSSI